MSSILVPVDFSLPCHNAYRFGLHLAEEFKLNVVLAHYSSGAIDPGQPLVFAGDGSLHGSNVKRLENFASSNADGIDYPLLEPPQGVEVTYEAEVVFSVSASIIARASKEDISMVVMAPRSTRKLLGKWLGSTSTTVSEACPCPVCLVPEDAQFSPWKKVVVANNSVTAEAYPLWQIEDIARKYSSYVHFVHVQWPRQYGPLKFTPWRLMEKLVDETPADYPFDVVTVDNEDVTAGLMEYADKIDSDLIVIVNSLRNRWRSLIHASLTQDLALRSKRPVLVLHAEDTTVSEEILQTETENIN
ncbi:universal stress protein [Neolewinella aurantiaca]|nr:universal stress protein [Neolewinella aurantiaca]